MLGNINGITFNSHRNIKYENHKSHSSSHSRRYNAKDNHISSEKHSNHSNKQNLLSTATGATIGAVFAGFILTLFSRKNLSKLTNQFKKINLFDSNKVYKKSINNKSIKNALNSLDNTITNHPFSIYKKNGIPLAYPRAQFLDDIDKILEKVPMENRGDFLAKFNLKFGNMDIDGIPNIRGFKATTQAESSMVDLIKKFYNNSTTINDEKTQKVMNKLLKICPEFTMVIGKPQHGTHIYSVDIHTLEVLTKAMTNPAYASLSDEGKIILKYSALLHDFGKKGNTITTGHASISKTYAKDVLENYPQMKKNTKNRILNLIDNHHWFEGYNKGKLSISDLKRMFPNNEDKKIAMILAKCDFESVNPTFHLDKLVGGKLLTQQEFDTIFADMMKELYKNLTN